MLLLSVQAGRRTLEYATSKRGGASQTQVPAGDLIGESSLMSGAALDFTAVASGAATAWRLHRLAFKRLILSAQC